MSQIPRTFAAYTASESGALRQGELITGLAVYVRKREGFVEVRHPFAIVISQDCDLDWDYQKIRSDPPGDTTGTGTKEVPHVLFAEAVTAKDAKATVRTSEFWKRVKQNKDERYQFLQSVTPEQDAEAEGLPELVLDFKRYFTIPTAVVYQQINKSAKRRSRLVSPYLEHLCLRFSYFQIRVALPLDHQSEPAT